MLRNGKRPLVFADTQREMEALLAAMRKAGVEAVEWELIDHETRKVRVQLSGGTDDEESDDEPVSQGAAGQVEAAGATVTGEPAATYSIS